MDVDEIVALATEVKEIATDNLQSVIEKLQSIYDDPTELIKYAGWAGPIKNLLKEKAPFLYPSWRFWNNVDKFFNSGVLSEEDKQKLIEEVSHAENPADTGNEIIEIIKKIETDKKLTYILRATKTLVNDAISLPEYLRICHVVMNTLEEDLQFLKARINEKNIPYTIEISGLMTTGLAYSSSMGENESMNYSFTPLAKIVNDYALREELNLSIAHNINEPPQTKFVATDEEFQAMLDEIFPIPDEYKQKAKT